MHRFFRWRERLNAAKNEHDIRQVVAEYLLSLDAEVVKALPAPCRDALSAADVQECAVALLHAELGYTGPEETRQLLHECAHTFAAAAVRLSKLRMEPIAPQGE